MKSAFRLHKAILDIEGICIHLKEYDIYFLECEIIMNKSRLDYVEFKGRLYFFKGNVTFDACIFLQDAFFNKTSFYHGVCFPGYVVAFAQSPIFRMISLSL